MDSEALALWATAVAAVGSLALQVKDAWPEKHDDSSDGTEAPDGEPLAPEEDQG